MKIKQLITKNYVQTQTMRSRFLATEHLLEWSPELMAVIINKVTVVPSTNILEMEIEPIGLDSEVENKPKGKRK